MGGGSSLPYDAEIEYIESTGTQFIQLSFGFANTDEVYTVFSVDTSEYRDKYMVAAKTWNNNNNRFAMGVHAVKGSTGYYACAYGNRSTANTIFTPQLANNGLLHSWQYKNRQFSVTDLGKSKDCSSYTFDGETKELKLFYGYNSNTKGKMQSYTHIKNGVTVIDLIAVRKGQVGYLYDKVSGTLFGNAGTGSFVLGPDKT